MPAAPITPARARAIGAARETENVDLVALLEVESEKPEGAFDVGLDAASNEAPENTIGQIAGADAGIVIDDLRDPIRRNLLHRLGKLDDVGDPLRPVHLVPRAVKANNDSPHWALPLAGRGCDSASPQIAIMTCSSDKFQ
jgi:hypothetical protein